MATDADQQSCVADLKCPCAEIQYELLDGADDTFRINQASGEIVLSSAPYKDDYVLEIGALNTEFSQSGNALVTIPDVDKQSKMYVHVDTRNYRGERIEVYHSRQRRSVSFCMFSFLMQCALPAITIMASWHLVHLGHKKYG